MFQNLPLQVVSYGLPNSSTKRFVRESPRPLFKVHSTWSKGLNAKDGAPICTGRKHAKGWSRALYYHKGPFGHPGVVFCLTKTCELTVFT